ncbi:hypothetical protein H4R26_005332, partial [Coemansia thaxteri]
TNCGPADPSNNVFGYLNGPGSSPCSTTVTVPSNIPDNTAVTLQWMWYGGGIYYGEVDTSFGEYYGCSDLIVSGGPFSDAKPVVTFAGGDATYPNSDVCKYWGSNKVGDCNFGDRVPSPIAGNLLSQSLEPCIRGPQLKGQPADFALVSGNQTVPVVSPVPQSPPSSSASYPASTSTYAAPPSPPAPASSAAASPIEAAPIPAPVLSSVYQAAPSSIYSREVPVAPPSPPAQKCIPRPVAAF